MGKVLNTFLATSLMMSGVAGLTAIDEDVVLTHFDVNESVKTAYLDDDDQDKDAEMKKDDGSLKPLGDYDALKKYEATGEMERKISLNRILRTQVLDDQTIVFFMMGKKAYVNRMKYKCPSLKSEDRFAYETFGGQLTSLDTISVIDSFGRKWASCGLADFAEFKMIKDD